MMKRLMQAIIHNTSYSGKHVIEGVAILAEFVMSHVTPEGEHLELWKVVFADDPGHTFRRWVRVEDIIC